MSKFKTNNELLEMEGKELFKPFITYDEYKSDKKVEGYMIWNTDLVYIYKGGGQARIITANSKSELLDKLQVIKRYNYEIKIGNNKVRP